MAKKVRVELDRRGIAVLLHDDDIHAQLRSVGEGIAARAGSEWSAEDWRNPPMGGRKTRTVVNVVNKTKGADRKEAESGRMARIIKGMEH